MSDVDPESPRVAEQDLGEADFYPRVPQSAWEGWFLIGIGGLRSPVRWTKTHVFRSKRKNPVAAVEGLESAGEIVTLIGLHDRIVESRQSFETLALLTDAYAFDLGLGKHFSWRGGRGEYTFSRDDVHAGLAARLEITLRDRLDWARLPGLVHYFGVHSNMRGSLAYGGHEHRFEGLGVMEHAWGASLPVHPLKFVRGRWHWDVLFFHPPPDGAPAALGALWIPVPGIGMTGVRGFGRLPDRPFVPVRPIRVRYEESRKDERRLIPKRWVGEVRYLEGILRYEAVASTPASPEAPGGGFLGFDFEGEYEQPGKEKVRLTGTGFTEAGGR